MTMIRGSRIALVAFLAPASAVAGIPGVALASEWRQAVPAAAQAGRWGSPSEIAASLNSGGAASVFAISCTSAGNCAAGGVISRSSGREFPFLDEEQGGRWRAA